ncbi:U3 small nucleolar RNA-associated protein 4-like protein [Gryllus bimaculatus]|nr:U3 small nucleolar RNA-associated protein 4-like protein [Gryllus bimaculatus]
MPSCKVHNVRFYNLEPVAIHCMSYEPNYRKLALSRGDNRIEVWDFKDVPHMECLLPNLKSNSVESLAWCDQRLFSTGLQGFVVEYNLLTLSIKYQQAVTAGPAWCLAVNKEKNCLAVGTEDGYINLFAITEEGLMYEKIMDKQEGKKLGELGIWSGHQGALLQSFRTHTADILSLCVSEEQNTIYCAGVDAVIYIISHVQVKADVWRWTKTYQRRIHEHDVRALAVSGPRLLSGGVDGYLAVSSAYPKTCFKYPPLLQNPAIVVCREARCILLRYWTHLEVWKLGQNADDPHPVKLLVLESAGGDPITCAALSSNSRWLAYSTPLATRFFSFEHHVDGQAPLLQKVAGLPEEVGPSHHITFSPDSSLAIVATNSAELIILKLGEGDPMVLHSFQPLESKLLKDRIFLLEVSNNGKFLVAADHLSNICVWTLDNGKYFCSLPRYNSAPTALGTQPENDTLVIAYADHTVVEYSLESRKYTEFSQRLTKRRPRQWLNKAFPVIGITFDPRNCDIIILYDDVTMHVINKTKDLPDSEAKIPRLDSSHSDSMDSYPFHPRVNDPQHALHVIKKYKHLVHLTWLMGDEVVAVEVSPAALDEQLPPILKKKRFGM